MKKYFYYCLCLLILSCQSQHDWKKAVVKDCSTKSSPSLITPLEQVLDSFLNTYSEYKYYDIYIDKVLPDSLVILLHASSSENSEIYKYSEHARPAITSLYKQDKTVYLHSGDEQLVKANSSSLQRTKPETAFVETNYQLWLIYLVNDSLRIDTTFAKYAPFGSFGLHKYALPENKNKDIQTILNRIILKPEI